MRKTAILLSLFLAGCESETTIPVEITAVTSTTTSTTTTTINKNIFSQWDQTSTPGIRMDFTGRTHGASFNNYISYIDTGAACSCPGTVLSANPGGVLSGGPCTYVGGGGSDPGCAAWGVPWTWSNSNGVLTLCEYSNPTNCYTFH